MRTVQTMTAAGMILYSWAAQLKKDESIVEDFDVRAYIVEKIEEAFYDIQAEITLAVQDNVAKVLESLSEDG